MNPLRILYILLVTSKRGLAMSFLLYQGEEKQTLPETGAYARS
jgi:hypothetical protein